MVKAAAFVWIQQWFGKRRIECRYWSCGSLGLGARMPVYVSLACVIIKRTSWFSNSLLTREQQPSPDSSRISAVNFFRSWATMPRDLTSLLGSKTVLDTRYLIIGYIGFPPGTCLPTPTIAASASSKTSRVSLALSWILFSKIGSLSINNPWLIRLPNYPSATVGEQGGI